MPRLARSWRSGTGAHVIVRFVDRKFLVESEDREALHQSIARAQARWDWRWLSFAMMSNHLHYGLFAGQVAPERFFRSAHTRFAQRFHLRRTGTTLGPVLAGRPSLFPVARPSLIGLVAYHHRNPVSAGIVDRASESTWTSHRIYLREEPAPAWLDVEWALDLLGFADTEAGRRRFDEAVMTMDLSVARRRQVAPSTQAPIPTSVDWPRLLEAARHVAGAQTDPLRSKRPSAVMTRRLVALVAAGALGQTYRVIAAQLGVTTGAVGNLLTRRCTESLSEAVVATTKRYDENDERRTASPLPAGE